ncbi:hypothetical protein BJY16_004316 [Actinoplanes octamycinicus]|uniref:Uncharacterized protein n=1 Tax=Actinoplanes octamycinicus TaxID=135948 RepID=A0A7W7GZ94_9ACTN|nr:DUF6114 domain-containing protein [Actinoplanes octamycinicus]MBB4740857.1 hypothetical protein [Actinoplanes octamycinicus]GIE55763.1 hypothetical protein Aoc01nite_11650 [Actinoplanes octamycinicus]
MATDEFGSKFRRWRRSRPFWGGLFLVLSGLFLLLSSNLSVFTEMKVEIHIGPQGFLSYVLPALMLLCGVLVWFTPAQRMFYGIVGLLTALYSFIGLNFGGWVLGMLFGIIGGALSVAWTPRPTQPEIPRQGPVDGIGPDNHAQGPSDTPRHHGGPGENTEAIQIAGHDDRPHETAPVRPAQSDPSILPGFDQPRGDLPGPRRGLNRKALAIIVVPAFVGATVLIGSRIPASADDCPEGLPSISTSVSPSASTSSAAKTSEKKAGEPKDTGKPDPKKTTTAPADSGKATSTASASASASATAQEDGNPILDGISDVVDGVGNLLGIGGDEESSSPSASPTASATETAKPTTEPTGAATTTPAGDGATTATSGPVQTTSPSASVSTSTDPDVIPCLGARQENKVADDGGIPRSAIKPGVMKVSSLSLYNSTYEGVADVPTANGTIKALQLNMTKAVNEPFSLVIDEPGNATTTIKSKKLVTEGNVKFYTPKMTGNLFGLIPITFTPEQPPPLTLPFLWFTNVTIDLAFVSCDTLTADPITITES